LNQLSSALVGQGKVLFQLTNTGTGNPIGVTNTAIIPQLTYTAVTSVNGTFSISLWGNDNINPANTLYSVTFFDNFGNSMGPVLYSITGASVNLNTAIAVSTVSPPVLIGGPAIVGNPLAPQTITGQSLTLTATAPLITLGLMQPKNIEGVKYIDSSNSQGWAGSDVGAWINAAIASFTGSGNGKIILAPGSYSMSTQVAIANTSFNLVIEGAGSTRAAGITNGITILNWTGGATPAFTIAGVNITFRQFQLTNTGTGTVGFQSNGAIFLFFEDVSIDRPTTAFSTAGYQNVTGLTSYIFFKRCKFENAAPIQLDLDGTNLVVMDNTPVNASDFTTVTTSVRIGNTITSTGIFLINGSDFEAANASTNATWIGVDINRGNTVVIENTFNETIRAGQFSIRVGANSSSVAITHNYFQGNAVGSYAIQLNGGSNTNIKDGNVFNQFVTAGINNVSTSGATVYGNQILGGTPTSYDSGSGIAFVPDKNAAEFGASTLAWNVRANIIQGFRSGGNPASPDIVGNSAAIVIGDANGVKIGTGGFLLPVPSTSNVALTSGVTSQKTESAADASVLSVTPAAVAGSYRLRFVMAVSAQSAATLGWTATWKDSNSAAQAPTNLALFASGTAAPALTFVAVTNGNYYGEAQIDVDASATPIVIKLTFSGTSFTAKVSATVERLV
jgi:hypothetical protein